MPRVELCTVQFVGGPFDGYRQAMSFPAEELGAIVAIPVNRNVLELLGGKRRRLKSPASSVALYELRTRGRTPQYHYVGAAAAEQFQLGRWRG